MKLTELEALENCLKHWEFILASSISDKFSYFDENIIPPLNHCYACEFAQQEFIRLNSVEPRPGEMCAYCPLNHYAWEQLEDGYACEYDKNSPYLQWQNAPDENEEIESVERMIDAIKVAIIMLKGCNV